MSPEFMPLPLAKVKNRSWKNINKYNNNNNNKRKEGDESIWE
jgi:hypothetical protein